MNNIIFLQKNKSYTINDTINLILSPEFYWVRIFDIPVDSKKEALSTLPNLFEDFIDIDGYKFFLQKLSKHKYLGFAYNENEIKQSIIDANIPIRKVQRLYFAQNELKSVYEDITDDSKNKIKKPIKIDDSQFIYQNDILVKLPNSFHQEVVLETSFDFALSSNYIVLNNYSKFISNKMAYTLSILFIGIALLSFFKVYLINTQSTEYLQEIESKKIRDNLPRSSFQIKSILENLLAVEKKYMANREILKNAINFKSNSKGQLIKVEYTHKKVMITYKNIDEKKIKKYFSTQYKNVKFTKNKIHFIVEIHHG